MLHDLIPAAAIAVGPILALAPVVYALRPQGGRHTGVLVPDWLGPYDLRVRQAIRHYADKKRKPYELDGDIIWHASPATDRDMTGAFPVVAVA